MFLQQTETFPESCLIDFARFARLANNDNINNNIIRDNSRSNIIDNNNIDTNDNTNDNKT